MTELLSRREALRFCAGAATIAGLGASTVALAGPAQAYPWPSVLRQGSSGAAVAELQVRVAGWAADSPAHAAVRVDGAFGPGTASAVRRFQAAYGLPPDGVVGTSTQRTLNSLESGDGSTSHFNWSEFWSKDGAKFSGGKVDAAHVTENVRRLMYKLEALRKKAGGGGVTVNSGFRSISHNVAIGGKPNSMHMYGIAADIAIVGKSTKQLYLIGETCGFSGLETYRVSWQHCDNRVEYAYGSQFWWWENGTVTRL
ncbi:D-Ala-D-Ala carboxypeptidase family metallohydrolase [Streptomyces canus]|uniref:D-Ala-D-Ala carboxypeptidase family metallohydrolase n=1 Tax=Streptomyces canus TaxID=58343 RepID=UPI0034245D0B